MEKKLTRNQFLLTALYVLMDERGYDDIQDPIEGTCLCMQNGDEFDIIYIEKPIISTPEIGDYSLTIYDGELREFRSEELDTKDLEYLVATIFKDVNQDQSYGLWLLDLAEKYKSLL